MKTIATACSTKKPTPEAVDDLKKQIGALKAKMVIFFASTAHEPAAVSRAMNDAFPEALVFGCSTSGEITSGKMLKGSLVAMAFTSEAVADVAVGVVPNVSQASSKGIADVFGAFEKHCGVRSHDMDFSEYVGLVLVDGMSAAEERVMDRIGDLTNVLLSEAPPETTSSSPAHSYTQKERPTATRQFLPCSNPRRASR